MKLTHARRMKTWGEFQAVKAARRSVGGRYVVVGEAECGERKFGLITSKRVGIAVVRNRMRRRLREIIRKHGDCIIAGRHVVSIARYTAPKASFAELEKDWIKQVKRLGLWKEEG